MLEKWVVLWSPHQDSFGVETVAEMLENNRKNFRDRSMADFIVLDIAGTHEEASNICSGYQRLRGDRKPVDESGG